MRRTILKEILWRAICALVIWIVFNALFMYAGNGTAPSSPLYLTPDQEVRITLWALVVSGGISMMVGTLFRGMDLRFREDLLKLWYTLSGDF
jgi:hypothetical protein